MELSDEELKELYQWVDGIPLSKPKKNINRDFSDGVLVAHIIKYHFPKLVELHNYSNCNGTKAKKANWEMLNMKVFKKLCFELDDDIIEGLINSKPKVIEHVLHKIRNKIDQAIYYQKHQDDQMSMLKSKTRHSQKTEADQYYAYVDVLRGTNLARDSPGRRGGAGLPRAKAHSPTRGGLAPVYHKQPALPMNYDNFDNTNFPPVPTATRRPVQPFQPHTGFIEHQRQQQVQQAQVDYVQQPEGLRGLPDSETVSTLMYDEKVQESLAKDEMIEILKAKVNQLEHLIHLKNVKVDALSRQLDGLRIYDKKNHAAAAMPQQKRLY